MLRKEYKYLVPNGMIDSLRSMLLPFMLYDKYALLRPLKEYTVRSIYYDNQDLDFYHEKVEGIKNRKKLRIRGYNEENGTNIVFLEIKRKNDSFVDKHRAMLNYKDIDELLSSGDLNYIIKKEITSEDDARRFLFNMNKKRLKPVSLVTYDREAFFSKFDSNFRVTFDKNLRYSAYPSTSDLYSENILKKAMKKHFILEIKFYRGYSSHIYDIIQELNLMRLSVSKYQLCVDAALNSAKPMTGKSFYFSSPIRKEWENYKEVLNND